MGYGGSVIPYLYNRSLVYYYDQQTFTVIGHNMKDAVDRKSTRDAILDATDRLLARYGYRKMTIDDLAQEVGIGKGSIYLHFSSKEEIALTHIDRIIERLKINLASLAERSSSVDERLRNMLVERVVYRFDSVQHYSQSLNDLLSYLRPKLLERRKRHFEEEARIFAQVISEGQASSLLIEGDAFDLAETLVTATNSLLPYSLSAFELGDRADLAERAGKTSKLLIRGLTRKCPRGES
ncbi:MAG: TetR/AcrR family transcriptional regulator [Pyrinomonadaceae bacterium]